MQKNPVARMIEERENEAKISTTRYMNDVLRLYKSCGTFLINSHFLQPKEQPNDKGAKKIELKYRNRTLNIHEKVTAFKPSATDFQISGNTITPVDGKTAKLEFYGPSTEVLAAQKDGRTYFVELLERPVGQLEKEYSNTINFLLQPRALRDAVCMLCERCPGANVDQDWRVTAEFNILIDRVIPSSLRLNNYRKHENGIKRLFDHDGIVEQLRFLADDCPFLWHDIKFQDLSFLGKLSNSCPIAIQNYLEHIHKFWKMEILGRGIHGAMDTLSGKSVRQLSGAFPLISSKDQNKILCLSKKPSPLLESRLSNSSQRILTLLTCIKEVHLLDSAINLITKLRAHTDKTVAKGSINFVKDTIILAPQISGLAKPSQITLVDNHNPRPRQYTLCMLWAMKNAGRSKNPMPIEKAVTEFINVATGRQPAGGKEGCAQPTSFRWITAHGSEIWREIGNLSDYFNLDYLIGVYDEFRNGSRNQESDEIPVSLLVWDIIRCFYTKPTEVEYDQAASLRCKKKVHFTVEKADTQDNSREADIVSDMSDVSRDTLGSNPGLSSATSSEGCSPPQPSTPLSFSGPPDPFCKEMN